MKKLAVAIAIVLMLPAWSFAGKDMAVINGTVQDSAGRFVSGALVSVTAGPSGLDRMALTDVRGAFSFDNLLPWRVHRSGHNAAIFTFSKGEGSCGIQRQRDVPLSL
jgi:hypothetical protein